MTNEAILADPGQVAELERRLSAITEVTRHDDSEHREAGTLAHAFADLEESFRAFLDKHLPKLMGSETDSSTLYENLLDIGEEMRHVLYHMKDPRFYAYLFS